MSNPTNQMQRSTNSKKSEVSITMHDLLQAPIQRLKYEVRRGTTILAQGFTDAEGKLAKVEGKIGDELKVYVARIDNTEEMKLIKTFQLTASVLVLPLISRKVLYQYNAIKHEGEKGTYKKSTYTVKSGDTLSKIAHAHNTTVDAIAQVNHIARSDFDRIEIGQVLTLPAPSTAPAPSTPEQPHHHRRHGHRHHPAHAPLQQQRSASSGNPTMVVPPIAGQLVSLDDYIKQIGDIIAGGEGGYESYNTGTRGTHGHVGHSYMHPVAGTVTNRSINEILATQDLYSDNPMRLFATGKYQTVFATLQAGKTHLGLSGDEKYDAAMQERMFREFLIYKAGGGKLAAFVKQGLGTIDDAQLAAADEWASIAAPNGARILDGRVSDGTLSYFESNANSANQSSTRRLRAILQEISQKRSLGQL